MSASGKWFSCIICSTGIWLKPEQESLLRESGQVWHCLWGHQQVFSKGPSQETLLRRERDRLKQEAARLTDMANEAQRARESAERRASAARGQVTRLKNSAARGACPCCNRVFSNLQQHMVHKHPEFENAETAE